MTLNPDRQPVPTSFITPLFELHRQTVGHNEADYAAVMDSRQELRCWSDSEWPEDDFTLQANLEDLHMHICEHDRDEAYGFSIFTPDGQTVLGSLYLSEVAPFIDNYVVSDADRAILAAAQVRVEYWLRRGTSRDLELALLQAVQDWLAREWWFGGVLFGSRRGAEAQRAAYEAAGLLEVAQLASKDGQRRFHFHAAEPDRRHIRGSR
ncbi:hypothetical protein [Deinococcus humi]|uniref:N-acetyltransferase domain-containing protein n=1 Tax=Deinococcus humi TaxID=662880 RepID=A0A7W8NGA2_9DEIO|nr:hypothetical protein [Deinococcus humi]MBB5365281.1 hypothetical protein [Deinococcus humi]GGO35893.1 hypothetical protein GCM10008949_39060 [Deinococcus humi]